MKTTALIIFAVLFGIVPAFGQADVDSIKQNISSLKYLKKYDEALAQANKAVEIHPSNASLYLTRANIQRTLNNNEAVVKDVWKAVLLSPNDAHIADNGALQLRLSGQFEEGVKLGNYLIASGKTVLGYRICYQNKFGLKDYAGAIEDVLVIHNVSAAALDGSLSKALYELRNDPKIEKYYRDLMADNERITPFSSSWGLMGLYSTRTILYADYATLYEETRPPAEVNALYNKYEKDLGLPMRAEIYRRMGKYDAAIADLTKLLESANDEDRYEYLFQRGNVYLTAKAFDKAIKEYELARSVTTDEDSQRVMNERIMEAKEKVNENAGQPK